MALGDKALDAELPACFIRPGAGSVQVETLSTSHFVIAAKAGIQ
jgi:hypothetical protein